MAARSETDPQLEALLGYLKEARGFDFTGYKRATLGRRMQRRMQLVGVADYAAYLDFLQVHPEEFTALFNTILINVTSFFRDSDAWDILRDRVVPELLAAKPTGPIRVWSAGCATGEEAYGLAIVFAQALGDDEFRERVKLYATDVDEEALAVARQATVSEQTLTELPPEIGEHYFETNGGRRTFRSDLRRVVIFGRNDLLQDAPISRIDLLACRNTLMYFNAETQARILERFHFALNDGGVLFLGKAEMLLSHGHLFVPVDLKHRVFRKVVRDPLMLPMLRNGPPPAAPEEGDVDRLRDEAAIAAPFAQITVAADGTVIATNLRADTLLGVGVRAVGRPLSDLDVSYRPVDLRTHIDAVLHDGRAVTVSAVEWVRAPGGPRWFDVSLVPLTIDGEVGGVTIAFEDVTHFHHLQEEHEEASRQLETAFEELQSTNEELETTNEELQSTVEELETTNEELQSTNEELETMNEELQSMNDELQSINEELRDRTTELDQVNRFMDSVLTSLSSAVIVIDRELTIKAWNRRAEDLWGLRREEVLGQHFLNLDIGLPVYELGPVVRDFLAGQPQPGNGLVLNAVNRRGKPISVRVALGHLSLGAEDHDGVILAIDETAEAAG